MKPWPVELQRMFPRNDGMRPDRPWWPDSSKHSGHVRRDGAVIYLYDAARECEVSFTQVPAMQDACDKEQPIPHPGFRVGQIWAKVVESPSAAAGFVEVFTLTAYVHQPAEVDEETSLTRKASDHFLVSSSGVLFWPEGLRGGSPAYTEAEALRFRLTKAFLVHDPVCPWLAPWSPPE
jgi:hypothetical protein